ncbi:MAG: ABC-2 family transporter protein [Bdellovibrionota bacterium]
MGAPIILKSFWTETKKNFSLLVGLFKASFISDLEFRFNFATRIITDIFWYLAQVVTFEVLFLHTPIIGHWNINQTRVFLGVLFIIDALYMTFLADNLDKFSEKVRRGELDLLLMKPVNSQFMVSFQRVATASLGNLIIALMWMTYALYQLPDLHPLRIFWLIVLIPVGFSTLYVVRFCFSVVSLIFVRGENIQFIWFQLYKLGMRPDSIYFPWLRYIVLTILPVGLIASVPARAILDPPNWPLFLWAFASVPIFIWFSNRFWKYCLSKYNSASS